MSLDLRDQLRRAFGPSQPGGRGVVQASSPAAVGSAHSRTVLQPRGPGIHDLVSGRVVEAASGQCFVGELSLGLDHVHGGRPLADFLQLADRAIACLARHPAPPALDRSEVLFLDTETTGLSGGTGTYVFIVGAGFFEGERFLVRQYFMRHHAEEPAMLAALNELFARFRAVVSFNGKTFDLPLLQTRFIASRQRSALRPEVHLDLLFPSRRFWRERLESCSLASIEQQILGHRRTRDVPAWVIPELYFRYLRSGDARPLVRVFDHNRHDLLSLVAIACRLGQVLGDPAGAPAEPEDLFAVARLYEDLGFWDDACACYEQVLAASSTRAGAHFRARVGSRLAALCKRAGRHERAVELWQRFICAGHSSWAPHVELAKFYEHRVRDFGSAIAIVEQALTLFELDHVRGVPRSVGERAELERRLARLLVKQRRASAYLASNQPAASARTAATGPAPLD